MLGRRLGSTLLVALLGMTGLGMSAAHAATVNCGDVIVASTTLDADVGPCPGDGIVVAGRGVILDLGGHQVVGAGSGAGIRVTGFGTWVRNGAVRGFSTGVTMAEHFGTLERLLITGNGSGVVVGDRDGNTIREAVITNNRSEGVFIVRGSGTGIGRSVVSGNGGHGVVIESFGGLMTRAFANGVVGNEISGNGRAGVAVSPNSTRTQISGNLVRANGGDGIYIASFFQAAFVSDNIVVENALNGIVVDRLFSNIVDPPNSVRSNSARGNGVQSSSFDLADRNPNCHGTSWTANEFLTRNQACIA